MTDVRAVLSNSTIFGRFSAKEIDILSQYVSVERFAKGRVLMKKGTPGTYLGIILSGNVDIIDENITYFIRSAGELVGEMALIRSQPRIVDVIAATDGEIAVMPFEAIERFKQDHPKIVAKWLSILTTLTIGRLGETEQETTQLSRHIPCDTGYFKERPFIAESPAMKTILEHVRRVGTTPVNVLIQGENGTGKELIARMIHEESSRQARPFVAVNCASIPRELAESEFFGHEKGAFTGAYKRREGYFEQANGGTLFLDEIAEMPLSIQPKFLRVIQEREGFRLGGTRLISYDVRLICATNKHLKQEVETGRFREDLYFRLTGVEFNIPPLRERTEDIAPLAFSLLDDVCRRFNKQVTGFSSHVISLFEEYHWPGNVRQLVKEIERMVTLTPSGDQITPDTCSDKILNFVASIVQEAPLGALDIPLQEQVKTLEIQLIRKALQETKGNRTHAAKLLGLTRQGLQKKIKRYGL